MSNSIGDDRGGVRTLDDLLMRCRASEGCLIWGGKHTRKGSPAVYLPALRKVTTLGSAFGFLKTGQTPGPGVRWHSTCGNTLCLAHRVKGNTKSMMAVAVEHGHVGGLQHRAKVAAGKRKASRFSEETIEAVRQSTGKLADVAMQHGMHFSSVSKIRNGAMRAPIAAAAASVFGWRP
jgi:hypothetical protein